MIKRIIRWFAYNIPLRNIIIFESCPDLSDNTKAVFDELIKRGYNKKYQMIWFCGDTLRKDYPKIKNVKYINAKNKKNFRVLMNLFSSKAVICCNRFCGTDRKDQATFYLCHGIPLKDVSSYYHVSSSIKYVIGTNEKLIPLFASQFNADEHTIIPLGFPRNDALLENKKNLSKIFGKFDKYIIWYPTVKTFNTGEKTGSIKPIQFVWSKEQADIINNCAKENNEVIIIKPHFAQLTSEINKYNFSNLKFIDDCYLRNNNITSYELLGSSDALLTDYSSVYFDYLLCDRPIGLIWEDINEYSSNPGLIANYEEFCQGGVKIYTIKQLCDFLMDIKMGRDNLKNERKNLLPIIHYSTNPDNAKRVTDFIIKVANI